MYYTIKWQGTTFEYTMDRQRLYTLSTANVIQMTSLERKSRAVNSSDIASQFANTLGKDTPVKKLKSKNSELLSKYREKLKSESDTADLEKERLDNETDIENQKHKPLPKIKGSFKGVSFDKEEESFSDPRQENKKRSWRKGKFSGNKDRNRNDNKQNNGRRKFKPFKRKNNSNGKRFNQRKGFNSKKNNESAN